jgi:hypothetical protein
MVDDEEFRACVASLMDDGENYDDAVTACSIVLSGDNSEREYINELEKWRGERRIWKAERTIEHARRERLKPQQTNYDYEGLTSTLMQTENFLETMGFTISEIRRELRQNMDEKIAVLEKKHVAEIERLYGEVCGLTIRANIAENGGRKYPPPVLVKGKPYAA